MFDVVMDAYSKALPPTKCAPYHEKMTEATNNSAELASRLRAAADATGMTRVDFARACGVSKQAMHSWLSTGRIDKQRLLKFAEVAGTTVHQLLGAQEPAAHYAPTKSNGPVLLEERRAVMQFATAWPFSAFSAQEYASLPPGARSIAEGFITGLIAANHTKSSNGTTGD